MHQKSCRAIVCIVNKLQSHFLKPYLSDNFGTFEHKPRAPEQFGARGMDEPFTSGNSGYGKSFACSDVASVNMV